MAEENWKKRSRIILDNALSRLGGVDVGKYPEHHFLRDSSQPPLEGWPLRIEFAGEDVWVAGCYRFRERSDTFSVEFVLEGRFRFRQNGEEFIAGPGDLFLVQPGRNSEIICDLDARARKRAFSLGGALLPALLESLSLADASFLRPSDPATLARWLDEGDALLRERPADLAARSAGLACRVLALLAVDFRRDPYPEPLREVLRYLDRNLERPFSSEQLAAEFRLSPATLNRLFRRHLGTSPMRYRITRRMEAAKRLLLTTADSIKEVAFEVGYSNALYFSSEFRRYSGESPREFRRRRRPGTECG